MPRSEKLSDRKRLRRLYEETNFGLLIQMILTAVQLYIFIVRNYPPKDGKYFIFTNIFCYLMLSSMDYWLWKAPWGRANKVCMYVCMYVCRSDTNKFRYMFSTAFIIIVINSQVVFSWLKYCVSVCQSSLRETLRQLQIKTLEQYSNSHSHSCKSTLRCHLNEIYGIRFSAKATQRYHVTTW